MSFGLSLYAADGSERLSNINTVLRKVTEIEYAQGASQTDSVSPFNNPVAAIELAPVAKRFTNVNNYPYYVCGYIGNYSVTYSDTNEEITFSQGGAINVYHKVTPQMLALYSYV